MKNSLSTIYVGLLFLFTVQACNTNSPYKGSIKIGITESNYTSEVGFDLEGNYRGDDYASRGIHE